MQCPNCQNDLVEIPTLEGPQLDVCPSRHGVWLDAGEVNLFVENYRALTATTLHNGASAVCIESALCPRCGSLLDPESVCTTPLFTCRACHGWWLPQGSLTQLNKTTRGGPTPIHLNEPDFYTRAAQRRSTSRPRATAISSVQSRTEPRPQGLWFWTTFLGGALILACFIFFVGIRKTVSLAHWTKAPDATLFFLALGIVGGIGLFIYGFAVNRRKQVIESIPTSSVRSLAVGLVEVTGQAQPEGDLLHAPFSGLPCVLFSYRVEERRGSGRDARWETITKGTSEQPFYVHDETGKVLVVPFGAQLMLSENRTYRNSGLGSLPDQTVVGLTLLGISADGWLGQKTIRCSEACLLPDEPVYVLGTAHENQGAAERTENSARLYIASNRDTEFIISDRNEKELLSRLQWQVFALLTGGPALAVICLLIILKNYLTPGH